MWNSGHIIANSEPVSFTLLDSRFSLRFQDSWKVVKPIPWLRQVGFCKILCIGVLWDV